MMGPNGGPGTADNQLTIDNLWKLLASEKSNTSMDTQASRGQATQASRTKKTNAP